MTELAEWSCKIAREGIEKRGDKDKWVASLDGFYQTRGHYSNNSAATIHDYNEGEIAWFCEIAVSDMLEEVLGKKEKNLIL